MLSPIKVLKAALKLLSEITFHCSKCILRFAFRYRNNKFQYITRCDYFLPFLKFK